MAIVNLNQTSSGATRNSGTDGDFTTLSDWALVTNAGWTIVQTGANGRVYKPASGNGILLSVQHSAAVSGNAGLATIRGCESATGVTTGTLVSPFPLVATIADTASNMLISNTASTTARNFQWTIGPNFCFFASNFGSAANQWDWFYFGDMSPAPAYSADTFGTVIVCRNSAATASAQNYSCGTTAGTAPGKMFICRSFDGTVKSVQGAVQAFGANIGQLSSFPAALAGPSGGCETEKCAVSDTGGTGTAPTAKGMVTRGWLPNLRLPLHSGIGTMNSLDIYTDTSYVSGSSFRVYAATAGFVVVEESNTWVAPLG